MKFDKETLIKRRFWILLGLAVPVSLAAIFLLLTAVGAEIAREREKLAKKLDEVKQASKGEAKNETGVAIRAKEAEDWEKEKAKVWKSAFVAQEPLTTWPDSFEKNFLFNSGLFAVDIVIDRKGETPAEPAKDDDNHFQGTVKQREKDYLIVVGQDKQEKWFFRTDKGTVSVNTAEGQKTTFQEIRPKDQVRITFEKGKYFYDPLTDSEQTEYTRSYHAQIPDILRLVDPVDNKGNGTVQLKGWFAEEGWFGKKEKWPAKEARFFSFVADDWKTASNISEEAWIAQEDLWIQRELYRLVRMANDYVSKYQGPGGQEKNKWYKFTNPYWQLELLLADGKNPDLEVKIKNRLDRRQKLDLSLRIRFNQNLPPEIVTLSYKPRDPFGSNKKDEKTGVPTDFYSTKLQLPGGVARTGIYEVEQVLTWETAAVKRIDLVSIGNVSPEDCSHSNRTFPEGTRPLKKEEKAEAAPAGGGEAGPGAGDGGKGFLPPGMPGMPGMRPGMPGGPGQGGGGDKATRTINGLTQDRYLEVTPQARRLPVAIALVVDQDHVDRVQTAFANSHLRFLTTQVILSRYPQSMRPNLLQAGAPAAGGEGGPMAPGTLPPGPGPMGRPPLPPGPMGRPFLPPGVNPQAGAGSGAVDDQESNMEMVIYGIVTFYERYPPRLTAPAPVETK